MELKTKQLGVLLAVLFFTFSNGQAQSKKEKKEQRNVERIKEVKQLLENKQFVFVADQAVGQKGYIGYVTGDNYSLEIMGDSAVANLPFYGTSYSTEAYGGDGGVNFASKLSDFTSEYQQKKKKQAITGIARDGIRTYSIHLEVYENGTATLRIQPSEKTMMTYYGNISKRKDQP